MNRLTLEKRTRVIHLLVEGNSINATVRLTGVSKVTILKLLVEIGNACSEYQAKTLVNLKVKNVQADEVWSFVGCKQKNVPMDRLGEFGIGDVWLWSAVDADTKLQFSWHLGLRTPDDALDFVLDMSYRVDGRFQLTTDGLRAYSRAVLDVFGMEIDYAMLHKQYGPGYPSEGRYSPAVVTGTKKTAMIGNPDERHISTSYVERTNLTLRMGNRRFTRLTNAHSKKFGNHEASISLHLMFYNFARPHETLNKKYGAKTTPAMAAGVADHVWTIEEIVGLLG